MITISNNDLKQLLLFVQTAGEVREVRDTSDLRFGNRVRLAKNTVRKLMKREDVQRVMGANQDFVVADK